MDIKNKAYRNILLPVLATASLMLGTMGVAEARHGGHHHGYHHGHRHAYGWHNGWHHGRYYHGYGTGWVGIPGVPGCVWVPAHRNAYGNYIPAHRRC